MEKKKIDLKDLVKSKYGEIAKASDPNKGACCGCSPACCGDVDYTIFSEKYDALDGYNPEADMGLGCGLPTEFAGIEKGHRVLDLGSGAGNDCFVAHALVGENGFVTGLDFTDEMIEKARQNKQKLGFQNIEFVKGDIEEMPFDANKFDVVVSNCVLNLVPDKVKAFNEIFRVLKPGGHFCVSDVVIKGTLPEKLKNDAEMYAGCVSGAIQLDAYLQLIRASGFSDLVVHKEKAIVLPAELLNNYLSAPEIQSFDKGETGIISVTVSAKK